jgi:hypothetical protein
VKDPLEVLRQKEDDIIRVRKEVDALRIVVQLLGDQPPHSAIDFDSRKIVEMP